MNRLQHERRIGSDEHGDGACTADWARTALGIDGNVTSKHKRVATIPATALHPVHCIKKCGRATVARVLGIDTFNVGVTVFLKQVHQHCFDRLGFVNDGLCADINTTNRLWVDMVFFKQVGHGRQRKRINVFAVVCEGHVLLTEADGVLALGYAVKILKFIL